MNSTSDSKSNTPARILVVDDDPMNRQLLRDLLEGSGYAVVEASDGVAACDSAQACIPDIILLDVLMPGMDGLEVCKRIKSDNRTQHVPVILITSQREREDRLSGIAAGASDFLTKPVDAVELRLRVRNWVNTKRLYDRVQEEYHRIAELEKMRDTLVHMVVHDLRSPLTCILSELDYATLEGGEKLGPEFKQCIHEVVEAARVMNNLVTSMLDMSRLENGEMPLNRQATSLHEIVDEALSHLGSSAQRVAVEQAATDQSATPSCDPELIRRVVVNLLNNATDYSPSNTPITVSISRYNGSARLSVSDQGPGIPEEFKERIFQKFGQIEGRTKIRKASTGIGLAFCRLAVEAHAGTIGVDSEEGRGSTFWFELPMSQPAGS